MEDLGAAQAAAIATAEKMRAEGERVSYMRAVFSPGDGRCFCRFDGESAAQVQKLNDTAGLPYERVVEAMDLPAPA